MKPIKTINARAIAAQILAHVLQEDQSLNKALFTIKKQYQNIDVQDSAFIQAMCYGVLRELPKLEFITQKFLQKPFKPKDEDLLYLIYLGLFQLIDLRTPDHAAIHETVEAVRKLGKPWATGLVNAILRNYLRQQNSLLEEFDKDTLAKSLHPEWLLNLFQSAWPNQINSIIEANNQHPPLSLRVNLKQISREDFLALLQQNSILASIIEHTEAGIILETAQSIPSIPGFKEGLFSVQDGASQLINPLFNLTPGLRILDACAAPGGKSAALLEQDIPISVLISLDKSESGVELIKDNFKRLKLEGHVLTGDASKPEEWWDQKLFDRILLDAPCSATGIIRRHPDIKYRRKENDISNFAHQQLDLLTALWPLLKENGILIYSTCSILPEENQQVIEAFIHSQPEAHLLPIDIPIGIPQPFGHQVLPGQNNMDGFFYARLQKRK